MSTFDPRKQGHFASVKEKFQAKPAKKPKASFNKNLLNFIGSKEAPKGYNQMYSGSKLRPPKPLTSMTINEVLQYQDRSVSKGSASSAAGQYQIIRKTLRGLVKSMGLTGNEKFDSSMQDRMGVHLMEARGLSAFKAGKISATQFGNNLAKEWASLPMLSGPKRGRSFYAGDGLNSSLTSTQNFAQVLGGKQVSFNPPNSRVANSSGTSGRKSGTPKLGFGNTVNRAIAATGNNPFGSDLLMAFQTANLAGQDFDSEGYASAILAQHNQNVENLAENAELASLIPEIDLDRNNGV